MSDSGSPLDKRSWEERYLSGDTRWDRGLSAPPFRALLATPSAPARGRIAVLGCGRGHDALLFARHGFAVTGFDFAPSAIRTARALAAVEGLASSARFEERDIFTLPGEHAGAFDAVLEHTCFCAIPPPRRPDYVRVVDGLLAPGGSLVALFYPFDAPHDRASSPAVETKRRCATAEIAPDDGPPFPVSEDEIRALFGGRFAFLRFETPGESFESRRGRERLAILSRRPGGASLRAE